jgi:hypothetical protein
VAKRDAATKSKEGAKKATEGAKTATKKAPMTKPQHKKMMLKKHAKKVKPARRDVAREHVKLVAKRAAGKKKHAKVLAKAKAEGAKKGGKKTAAAPKKKARKWTQLKSKGFARPSGKTPLSHGHKRMGPHRGGQ